MIFVIVFSIIARLIPHPPNFASVGAMALFGGAYLNKKYSIIIVLAIMVISDYLLLYVNPFSSQWINLTTIYAPSALVHSTAFFVYAAFIINVLIGWILAKKKSTPAILAGSLAASLQFFLITNFGVWASGMYERGLDGLLQSYVMGLPFFKWTILGDLIYSALFFSVYEMASRINLKPKLLRVSNTSI